MCTTDRCYFYGVNAETVSTVTARAARRLGRLRGVTDRVGWRQPSSRLLADAREYWTGVAAPGWKANSHWRSGLGDEAWLEVGAQHLAIFQKFRKALDTPPELGVVIDWGCGGGANAAAFAPISERFIAADVSRESLAECVRQVGTMCSTPIEPLHIEIEHPERAITGLEGHCDVFLCLYVLELTAGPDEALRILRIAERILVPGGMAFVQMKYHAAGVRRPTLKRNYRRNLANMTTFEIAEFWSHSIDCGLTPQLLTLVPENRLDTRYAYFALTKPVAGAALT